MVLVLMVLVGKEIAGPLAAEKLAPMSCLFTVSGDDEAISLCRSILHKCGKGHTASDNSAQRFAREIEASRLMVNAGSAQGCIGFGTGLNPPTPSVAASSAATPLPTTSPSATSSITTA